MESQSHDDNQAQEQHQTAGDQHQEGGEKKSVMKKMKDRAKKMRETIKNYGQHGHDEMNTPPDNHDLVEEDSDEEILEDPPEIHGPPMYDSVAGTGAQRSQPEERSRPGVADERRSDSEGKGEGKGGDLGRTGEFLETSQHTPVQSFQSQGAPAVESPEQRNVHLEIPRGMEEDHAANTDRTSSYQSKVTDPAVHGRPEIHGAPMCESGAGTGAQRSQPEELSRPQNADEEAFVGGQGKGKGGDLGRTGQLLENTAVPSSHRQEVTFAPAPESPEQRKVHPEIPRGMEEDPADQTSNYQSKVTDPTGRGEEARDITPMIQSFGKLGMRDEEENRGEKQSMSAGELPGSHDPEPATVPEQQVVESSESERQSPRQGGYMSSIASTAASLGTSLMSRVVGSGTATETETITGMDNSQESEGGKPKQSSVAEKIGPVDEKAAGAGTGTGKIVGPGNQTSQETKELGSGVEGDHENSGEGKGMSMSSYLSEKLKPGEEDEALSEVISEKLLMKKGEETREHGEEGSDDPVKGGNGMVDKLRGAVGSWFSKPGQPNDSVTYNDAADQLGEGEGEKEKEKQLQKPGN